MKNAAQKIFTFLFVVGILVTIALKPAAAQTIPTTTNVHPSVEQNTHTWTQTVMIEVLSAATCQIAGVDPLGKEQKCLGIDPVTRQISYVENTGGAIGALGGMIASLYTPPIHASDYFQHVARNFGVVKSTHAAPPPCDPNTRGIGFCGIQPLLNLWIAFRNLVFLLFVLIFVLVGIAIMLRIQIDPRTVMSIENSVPKIIIALLLISFSFALAGFLIDLMYLGIYVVFNFFAQPDLVPAAKHQEFTEAIKNTQASIQGDNPFQVLTHVFPSYHDLIANAAGSIKDIVANMFYSGAGYDPAKARANENWLLQTMRISQFLANPITTVSTTQWGKDILGSFIAYLGGALAYLVIAIALLIAMFRLWFTLLTAYIYILIDIVLAPFYIVGGVFPGSPVNFELWLRDLIANLSSFVVTIAMFLLGRVFIDAFSSQHANIFVPPMIGNPTTAQESLIVSTTGGFTPIAGLLGVGIILMTPVVVSMMREVIKAPTFKYMAEAFKSAGAGQNVMSSGVGTLAGAGSAYAHGTAPVGGGAAGLQHYFLGRMAQASH